MDIHPSGPRSVWWAMEFGTYEASDGVEIRYGVRITPAGRPIVLANGRGEFIEKYAEVINELAARGFTVWTFDWRGQGLSTRLLDNPQKGYVSSFEDYLADFHGWMTDVVMPRVNGRPALLAHSMGGHLALRYLADQPDVFERAVVVAPLVKFPQSLIRGLMVFLLRVLCWLGLGRWYFVRGDYDRSRQDFEGNRLTGDRARFEAKHDCIAANPKLALGGVTLGWLVAAGDSIAKLTRRFRQITVPVLLVAPEHEQVVDGEASVAMVSSLPTGEVCRISGAKHEVLFESDAIRAQCWAYMDTFLGVEGP